MNYEDMSVFELLQNLWKYWKWKRDGFQWCLLDVYINDNFFQLYAKWQFYLFADFDYIYDNIKRDDQAFNPEDDNNEQNYSDFLCGLLYFRKKWL